MVESTKGVQGMGLSASQARLLSLTSRLSDLELRAQAVSNSKIRLADQAEQASQKYSDALDKQTMKVYSGLQNDGTASYIDATARNLTTYNAISSTDKQRFIKNAAGNVLVSGNISTAYANSNGSSEVFLNNLGYSQFTTAERKASLKASSLGTLSSDLATAIGSISYVTNTTYVPTTVYNDVTSLEPATKNQLDTISSSLAASKSGLSTLSSLKTNSTTSQAADKTALSNSLNSIHAQLTAAYNAETDSTRKAAIAAEVAKAQAAINALATDNIASVISNLQSIDTSLLSPKVGAVYATEDAYIQTSSGHMLISQQLAKCIDVNGGATDTVLNGGLQSREQFLTNCVTSGFLTNTTDTFSSEYQYYSNLYDLISTKGYEMPEKAGAISDSNTLEVGRLNPGASVGANEASSTWLQSQINAGTVSLFKLNRSTGIYENTSWSTNGVAGTIATAIGQANALQSKQTTDATAITTQTNTVTSAIGSMIAQLQALYDSTTDPTQKAAILAQLNLANSAQASVAGGDVAGATNTLNSIDITSLYETLKTTKSVPSTVMTPVYTDEYSSTLSSSAMAAKLNDISNDLGAVSTLFTGGALQSYVTAKQAIIAGLLGQLSGTTISSSVAKNIQDTLNAIQVGDLSTLIDNSTLTKDYNYDKGFAIYNTNLFNEIKDGNGCMAINDEYMNSSDWLQAQIDSGNIYLYEYNSSAGSKGTGDYVNVSWTSGDSSLSEVTNDRDTAKAEAEYETTMASIQSKDKRFDVQLANIDTEHTAVQTEVESVKKVINKNIERSFKIFDA